MIDFANMVKQSKGPVLFSVGQAGFILKSSSGQLLGIDLYLSNCVEQLEGHVGFKRLLPEILSPNELIFDVVICTHPHYDHFDVDSIPEIMQNGSKLFASVDCKKLVHQLRMEKQEDRITYVRPGDHCRCGDFDLIFVDCDHGEGAPDAFGVIIKVDGKVLYEVGDSCLRLDRVNEIPKPIDVLMGPINGMYGNMNEIEMIQLSEAIQPELTIPCHYGMFASHGGDLKAFYDIATKKNIKFLIMQQGEMLPL